MATARPRSQHHTCDPSDPAAHHRGAADFAEFAERFIRGRLAGFNKDLQICFTGIPREDGSGRLTYAFFPALSSCCSTLEYLTCFFRGKLDPIVRRDIEAYAARYMPAEVYTADAVRILFEAFRNRVNHRGIPTGVWVDRHRNGPKRRLVWSVKLSAESPAIEVRPEVGTVVQDSPWPCAFTHRATIRLRRLAHDICRSADPLIEDIRSDRRGQDRFRACMEGLYPRSY